MFTEVSTGFTSS